MSNTSEQSSSLVTQLNALLQSLHLPIPLESPLDLTPSLLLAILESFLSARLPISPTLRRSLSPRHTNRQERTNAEIQSMKIFLGVLENDILKMDVGLSDIDPRRLAKGGEDEMMYIAELLCWIGRRIGLLHDEGRMDRDKDVSRSPTPSTTITKGTASDTQSLIYVDRESNTSVSHDTQLDSLGLLSSQETEESTPRPRCIHEIPSPLILFESDLPPIDVPVSNSASFDDFSQLYPQSRPRVRYTGYIQPVDEHSEIESFEANRSALRKRQNAVATKPTPSNLYNRTVTLLNQRAQLLGELAMLKAR